MHPNLKAGAEGKKSVKTHERIQSINNGQSLWFLWLIYSMGSGWLQDGSLKFNKMSDEDKKRFIEAVTGSGGKIDSKVLIFFRSVIIFGTKA